MPRAPKGEAAKRGSFMQHAGKFMQLCSMVLGVSSACRSATSRTSSTPSPGSGGHNIKGYKASYQQRMQPSAFWQTEWGKLLRNPSVNPPGSKVHKEFISEFGVPFSIFEDIVQDCKDQKWTRSSTALGKKKVGRPSLPLESKILGCLYRLGSGCLPRTQGRLFGSSRTVADQFFLDFCAFYAQKYGEECVVPATEAERQDVEEMYAKMGFPGCLGKQRLHLCVSFILSKYSEFLNMIHTGSVDGVHVHWVRCPFKVQALHKGVKGVPTRSCCVCGCVFIFFTIRDVFVSHF